MAKYWYKIGCTIQFVWVFVWVTNFSFLTFRVQKNVSFLLKMNLFCRSTEIRIFFIFKFQKATEFTNKLLYISHVLLFVSDVFIVIRRMFVFYFSLIVLPYRSENVAQFCLIAPYQLRLDYWDKVTVT